MFSGSLAAGGSSQAIPARSWRTKHCQTGGRVQSTNSARRTHLQAVAAEVASSRKLDDLQAFKEQSGAAPFPAHILPGSGFEKDEEQLSRIYNLVSEHQRPDAAAQSNSAVHQSRHTNKGLPVYVMLPLDTVWIVERDKRTVGIITREKALDVGLRTLKMAGVEGVMVDVWWGMAEHSGPGEYDFSAYKRLFDKIANFGLKIQTVMSFHAAGGNVGDTCKVPLPRWVLDVGEQNPDIYYTDRHGVRNRECLSLGCDEVPLFEGRTPVDIYRDFINAFADKFDYLFGDVITEITVGMGPAGELRYPSYPEGDGRWRFPGVGEFQCYDKYLLASLKEAADAAGHPEWGNGGPHDAGHYNSNAYETGFFHSEWGSWNGEYGRFFLTWYSNQLLQHADRLLTAASSVLNKHGRPRRVKEVQENADGHVVYEFESACKLCVKLAGVHWWFKSRSHAAELTAGYYNTWDRDGYEDIARLLKKHHCRMSFTCVEMRDCEHPPEGCCSPQGLLNQVIETTRRHGVPLAGENALQRYDTYAFDRIAESAFGRSARAGRLEQLTFLRMGDLMFDNWGAFSHFLQRMRTPPEHFLR